MSRFVRASKFRHVFGYQKPGQASQYKDLKVSRNTNDSNMISVGERYAAVLWEFGGGGGYVVFDHTGEPFKFDNKNTCTFNGHTSVCLDVQISPYHQDIVASCSEDCKIMIWQIPEGAPGGQNSAANQIMKGHQKKVTFVKWNPVAENILASASGDLYCKVWDIEAGKNVFSLDGPTDLIQSIDWSGDGKILASTCKDKTIRLWDARTGQCVVSMAGHQGIKGSRVAWKGDTNHFVTTGFSKATDRQFHVYDLKGGAEPLATHNLDTSSGVLMPFIDPDTNMLYLAGKGDGNIRYFELVDEKPFQFFLSEFSSSNPTKGLGFAPKRVVDINNCEVMKGFRLTTNTCDIVSMRVPRKADTFQGDIYPDCLGDKPGVSAQDWIGGKDGLPAKISLENGFTPGAKKVIDFVAPPPANLGKSKDLENPKNDKEFQEAFYKQKEEIKVLQDKLTQAGVQIHALELKLKN